MILLTAIAREAGGLANTGEIRSAILAKPIQLQELLAMIAAGPSLAAPSSAFSDELPPRQSGGIGPAFSFPPRPNDEDGLPG